MLSARGLLRPSSWVTLRRTLFTKEYMGVNMLIKAQDVQLAATMDASAERSKVQTTFASMLRNSNFVQMGDPVGKVVVGKIYHIVNDDLYIDFGGKFPAVCQRPRRRRDLFVRGSQVRLLVKRLEMSEKFLGFEKEVTLCEAECVLLGLHEAK